jgi:hypothetical protein
MPTKPIHFTEEEIAADPILYGLRRDKLALSRENYVIRNWGDVPEEWNAEYEAELPEKMQNWSQFEGHQGE